MASFNEAINVKDKLVHKLLNKNDIFGVGVGFYDPKDRKKGAGIIIYSQKLSPTSKKKPLTANITSPSKLTTIINGKKVSVPVRIVNNKFFKANVAETATRFTRRIRPVIAGYSVGIPIWSGTAGLIVTNYPARSRLFLASNNHVLNRNNSTSRSVTVQPGGADGGTITRDRIGYLYRFVKLNRTNNYLDAALSIPLRNSLLAPKYAIIGTVRGHYANYRVGWRFIKVGRTTGLVGGVVDSVNTDVKVNYGSYGGLGTIVFRNQTIITSTQPISLPGDSGSVWLHSRTHYATAVNYAGTADGRLSVAFPIHWLMQVFGTRVAIPGSGSGRILRVTRWNAAYTRPLSSQELRSIRVLRAKI